MAAAAERKGDNGGLTSDAPPSLLLIGAGISIGVAGCSWDEGLLLDSGVDLGR